MTGIYIYYDPMILVIRLSSSLNIIIAIMYRQWQSSECTKMELIFAAVYIPVYTFTSTDVNSIKVIFLLHTTQIISCSTCTQFTKT